MQRLHGANDCQVPPPLPCLCRDQLRACCSTGYRVTSALCLAESCAAQPVVGYHPDRLYGEDRRLQPVVPRRQLRVCSHFILSISQCRRINLAVEFAKLDSVVAPGDSVVCVHGLSLAALMPFVTAVQDGARVPETRTRSVFTLLSRAW
jgi:hypothetical protein